MAYFLALDAGGSKTECALADDTSILARVSGGSIKLLSLSARQAKENLDALLHSISAQSGVPLDRIACTCVGLSGLSVPSVAAWTRQALVSRVAGRLLLAGDEEIALDAAFPNQPGVLIVAGTGSNIIGRSSAGEIIRVGGWGPALADEGSGNWIGRQAVRAIFRALDYGETTLLLQAVLDSWKLADMGALIEHANRQPAPEFSALAPVVMDAASRGDRAAVRVLHEAGEALAGHAVLAAHRLCTAETEPTPHFAFTGSVLCHIPPVRDAMLRAILRELPGVHVQNEPTDALQGAIWRARQHTAKS